MTVLRIAFIAIIFALLAPAAHAWNVDSFTIASVNGGGVPNGGGAVNGGGVPNGGFPPNGGGVPNGGFPPNGGGVLLREHRRDV